MRSFLHRSSSPAEPTPVNTTTRTDNSGTMIDAYCDSEQMVDVDLEANDDDGDGNSSVMTSRGYHAESQQQDQQEDDWTADYSTNTRTSILSDNVVPSSSSSSSSSSLDKNQQSKKPFSTQHENENDDENASQATTNQSFSDDGNNDEEEGVEVAYEKMYASKKSQTKRNLAAAMYLFFTIAFAMLLVYFASWRRPNSSSAERSVGDDEPVIETSSADNIFAHNSESLKSRLILLLSRYSSQEVLGDPATPQGVAFDTILFREASQSKASTVTELTQRFGLLSLYYSTQTWNTVWNDDDVESTSECTWFGIQCSSEGVVTSIELRKFIIYVYISLHFSLLSETTRRLTLSL